MKNGIVYSIHVNESKLADNYNFEQLKSSVQSIRDVNNNIGIKVYLSPITKLDLDLIFLMAQGVEVVPFNAEADPRLEHKEYALWTSHKWQSAFKALKDFDFDNVLYVDTDTVFQKDPEYLFEKYGNSNSIYGMPDVSDKWTTIFNVQNGGMNDGQFILSKKVLKYEEDLLKARVEYVVDLQEKFKDEQSHEIKITGIQWVACQYGVSEYLNRVGNPLKFFDFDDVHIIHKMNEFIKLPKEKMDSFALIHYLNYNTQYFFPKAYEIYMKARNGRS